MSSNKPSVVRHINIRQETLVRWAEYADVGIWSIFMMEAETYPAWYALN